MRKTSKIITALALAGIAVAGGAAFTAGGVTDTSATKGFVGGSVSQNVEGAVLTSVNYTYGEELGIGTVSSVALTFSIDAPNQATGKDVNIAFTPNGTEAGGDVFNCEPIDEFGASTCTPTSLHSHVGPATALKVTVLEP
jgi:hypothetical protein